jgi:hypothetical protein
MTLGWQGLEQAGMSGIGWKWLYMAGNGWNGLKWLEMAEMPEFAGICCKLLKMAGNLSLIRLD